MSSQTKASAIKPRLAMVIKGPNFGKISNLLVKKDAFCVTQSANFSKN